MRISACFAAASIVIFASSAHAEHTVTKWTGDAKGMVDLCNASGGHGVMSGGSGVCFGKDGGSVTACSGDPHGVDNCITVTTTKIVVKKPSNLDRTHPRGATVGN